MNPEYKKAFAYALWRIASQSYHSVPLSKLLSRKLYPKEIVTEVISECIRLGYLNDQVWLENYVKGCSSRQGRRAICAKLRSKGIPFDENDITVEGEVERDAIDKILKSRYRLKDLNNFQDKQKVIAGLKRRGFGWDAIQEALRAHSKLKDDFEE